jgi:hypothetical protein
MDFRRPAGQVTTTKVLGKVDGTRVESIGGMP